MQQNIETKNSNAHKIHEAELAKIAEGAGVNFLGKIADSFLKYLFVIIAARFLGAGYFGLFALGLAVTTCLGLISRLGLDGGVIRYVSVYNGDDDKQRVKGVITVALKYTFFASVLVGVILFLAAKPLSVKVFNKPELENVIKLLSISIPFYSFALIALSCTRGFQVMRYMVYGQNLFLPATNLLLVILLLLMKLKINAVIFSYLISVFLTAVLSFYFLNKVFPEFMEIKAVPETRKLFRFSVPLLIFLFFNFIIMWTDTLMLGHFRTSNEVGVYNAAMKTALLTGMILLSFNAIFAPMISDLYNKKQLEKLQSLFKTVTKWIYTMSLPIFLLIALLPKEIMGIFGEEFVLGYKSLFILAFAQLISASVGSVGTVLAMSGKQDIVMYNTLGICIVNIILNYILIPIYGITGAAIASGLSTIIFNLVMLLEVYLLLKMHSISGKFLKPTVFGLACFVAMVFIKGVLLDYNGPLNLLIYIPLFLFIFTGLIYKWGIDDEDQIVVKVFKSKLQKVLA